LVRSPPAWRTFLHAPTAEAAEVFGRAIAPRGASLAVFEDEAAGGWLVEAVARARPDAGALGVAAALVARALGLPEPSVGIEPIPATDWLAATREAFPPIRAGRFTIHGTHTRGRAPAGTIPLAIDAATAFGSGEHPTTRGCLLALGRLARGRRPARVLDLGCGSGILALAMARLWHCRTVASDIDPEAVRVARHNARVNGLGGLAIVVGDGPAAPAVAARAPYDVVAANILAGPLARMAPALARVLAPGGRVVLSGLLLVQERRVLAAMGASGLALEGRVVVGAWPTLVVRRGGG
jgi:ribosomal protein L11 methyltransferase